MKCNTLHEILITMKQRNQLSPEVMKLELTGMKCVIKPNNIWCKGQTWKVNVNNRQLAKDIFSN